MIDEKRLLDQIRKRRVRPLIGTVLVFVVIMAVLIFAAFGRATKDTVEMVIAFVLMGLLFGSGVFVELYQFLNPQKNIFFRKYGKPAEAVSLVNEALSEEAIFETSKLIITEHYIYSPENYATLVKTDDVLLAFEEYTKDDKKEFANVAIVDKWGVKQLFKFSVEDISKVREAMAVIRESLPNIRVGSDAANMFYVSENRVELPKS